MRVRLALMVAATTAAGGLLAGLGARAATVSDLDPRSELVVRALLVGCVVLLAPYVVVRANVLRDHRRGLVASGLAGVVAGYALDPLAWQGRAFFGQLVAPAGPATTALDLAGWLALGAVAVLTAGRVAVPSGEPVGYRG